MLLNGDGVWTPLSVHGTGQSCSSETHPHTASVPHPSQPGLPSLQGFLPSLCGSVTPPLTPASVRKHQTQPQVKGIYAFRYWAGSDRAEPWILLGVSAQGLTPDWD